jgi:hypothetical protein
VVPRDREFPESPRQIRDLPICGVEDQHNGTCLQPAWALIDCINLRDLQVLSGIEALTILVDHDQAGQSAADICTRRWLAAGHCVEQLIPRTTDTDFNDIAMGGGE